MTTSSRIDALRVRFTELDPFTPLVGLVALVVYSLHGFGGALNRDLGVYAYAGQQFADGVPPYEGILNRAGPLAHMLPGVGMAVGRLFGVDDVTSARVLFMLFSVAAVCVTYMVGRDLFSSRWGGLVSATSLLSFLGFIEYATNGPREKTPMVLFVLLAMWCVTRNRFLIAGICVGLATLTWQPAFLVGVTLTVLAAVMRPDHRLRSLLETAVGGTISIIACSAYFLTSDAWNVFYEGFFEINARYSGAVSFPAQAEYLTGNLRNAYGASLWLILVGWLALVASGVASIAITARRSNPERRLVAAFAAATVVGLAWTWHDINGWADLFVLLPSAAIGVGAVVPELEERLPSRAVLAVAAGWALVATTFAAVYAVTERSDVLASERASVHAVLRSMPPDATLLSIQAPQAMVLAQRTNPTRFQMFPHSLQAYMDDSYPGGMDGFVAWLEAYKPTIVAVQHRWPRRQPWLDAFLQDHYKRVGSGIGWDWYMAQSAGDDAISKVERALRNQAP